MPACPRPSEPSHTPLQTLSEAFVATTGDQPLLRTYAKYRSALMELIAVSDPFPYTQALQTLAHCDKAAESLVEDEGDESRLRELIKASYELIP